MRIYIIGNDGITLCHEAPAPVNEGEIAVASNEELNAAPLSGKRLLALWNALPGRLVRLPPRPRTGGGPPACWRAEARLIDGFIPLPVRRCGRRDRVALWPRQP